MSSPQDATVLPSGVSVAVSLSEMGVGRVQQWGLLAGLWVDQQGGGHPPAFTWVRTLALPGNSFPRERHEAMSADIRGCHSCWGLLHPACPPRTTWTTVSSCPGGETGPEAHFFRKGYLGY